jgi:hypothetical protein
LEQATDVSDDFYIDPFDLDDSSGASSGDGSYSFSENENINYTATDDIKSLDGKKGDVKCSEKK